MGRERVTNPYHTLVLDISPLAGRVRVGDRPCEMSREARFNDPGIVCAAEPCRIRVYLYEAYPPTCSELLNWTKIALRVKWCCG